MASTDEDEKLYSIKTAQIYATPRYPIVSAYEFEFLKEEDVVRERIDNCTIYMIVQRPLTYFDNVVPGEGEIRFEIADGSNPPLQCKISLTEIGLCGPDEEVEVEVQFYTATPDETPPYRDVGGLKVKKADGTFLVWWTPQKFLYEVMVNRLKADISGDVYAFLDFRVHYIGQAFSQKVWQRLTGHSKMQRILTVESPIGASTTTRAPFEISLIMLSIVGIDEVYELPHLGFMDRPGVKPIRHCVEDEGDLEKFLTIPFVELGDIALTRELEAALIQAFRPAHNETMFENYPNITGGMRSKGYTWTDFVIKRIPARLYTDHHPLGPIEFANSKDSAP